MHKLCISYTFTKRLSKRLLPLWPISVNCHPSQASITWNSLPRKVIKSEFLSSVDVLHLLKHTLHNSDLCFQPFVITGILICQVTPIKHMLLTCKSQRIQSCNIKYINQLFYWEGINPNLFLWSVVSFGHFSQAASVGQIRSFKNVALDSGKFF